MPKHVASAVICALLATSVGATVNAAHEGLEGHPPRSGSADGILTQINDAFLGPNRRTFLDLAEYLNELRPRAPLGDRLGGISNPADLVFDDNAVKA